VALFLLCTSTGWANLFRYPEQLEPLQLETSGSHGWSAEVAKISPPAGILYPGDTVKIELKLCNSGKTAITAEPTLEVVRVGDHFERFDPTRGDPMIGGMIMRTVPLAPPARFKLPAVAIKAGGSATLAWAPAVSGPGDFTPFGLYAVILDVPGLGRQGVASFARVYPPNPAAGDGKDSPLLYCNQIWYIWGPEQLDTVARLGFKWVRTDGFPNWNGAYGGKVEAPFNWTNHDEMMAHYRRNGLYIMSNMYGSPDVTVTPNNRKAYNMIHEEKYDERMGDFVEECVRRYCGPDGKGPLQIIDYYNEPWEGGGISGWNSDSIRYRKLYKTIYDRAHKGSPWITVGGSSSIMNNEDKFFTRKDWQKDYRFDVLTDHYCQPYACWGPRVAQKLGIYSIETETWMGSSPDRMAAVSSHFIAAGQRKLAPNHPDQVLWKNGALMCRPTAVASNAFLHFTAGRRFHRVVFLDHLPWLYQWSGKQGDCFILAGDRHLVSADAVVLYDQIRANGTIAVSSLDGKLKAYDVLGNLLPVRDGKYVAPCSFTSIYLEAPGLAPDALVAAVAAGRMEGAKPVELLADDFVTPITKAKSVDVDVHNVLNRPISGTLTAAPPAAVKLAKTSLPVTLGPGETRSVKFPILAASASPANGYEFTFNFAGDDGKAELREVLEVHTIAYGTPSVDGSMEGWRTSTAVLAHGAKVSRDISEKAWRPWEKEPEVTKGRAEVRFMWDDRYFYVSVRDRNKDWTPKASLAHRDDDRLFGTGDMAHTYVKSIYDSLPGAGHCLQIGIGLGLREKLLPPDPLVPKKMIVQADTDYEYDIWKVPEGRDEIWRGAAPYLGFCNFLPRCMPEGYDGVPRGASVIVQRRGIDTIYQAAIPLSDMPELAPRPGKTVRMTFALPGSGIFFGAGRSRTRFNALTLLPTWTATPSNDLRWGFTGKAGQGLAEE
jgi:hypothetical protein